MGFTTRTFPTLETFTYIMIFHIFTYTATQTGGRIAIVEVLALFTIPFVRALT